MEKNVKNSNTPKAQDLKDKVFFVKPATQPAEPEKIQVPDLRKLLDAKLEQIQKLSGLHTKLTSLQSTLMKIKEFSYTSTKTNDFLKIKDGDNYSNEFVTSNVRYVEKVRDFLITEMKQDIEATEQEIQAATL